MIICVVLYDGCCVDCSAVAVDDFCFSHGMRWLFLPWPMKLHARKSNSPTIKGQQHPHMIKNAAGSSQESFPASPNIVPKTCQQRDCIRWTGHLSKQLHSMELGLLQRGAVLKRCSSANYVVYSRKPKSGPDMTPLPLPALEAVSRTGREQQGTNSYKDGQRFGSSAGGQEIVEAMGSNRSLGASEYTRPFTNTSTAHFS